MPSLLPTKDTNVKAETLRNYTEGLSCVKAPLYRMLVCVCVNVIWGVCVWCFDFYIISKCANKTEE